MPPARKQEKGPEVAEAVKKADERNENLENAPEEAPGGFSETNAPEKEAVVKGEAKEQSLLDNFQKLSVAELRRLSNFVASALEGRGNDAEEPVSAAARNLSATERAGALPVNKKETEDFDREKVAKKFDLDADEVIGHSVRAATRGDGTAYGEKYLTVVTSAGEKRTITL